MLLLHDEGTHPREPDDRLFLHADFSVDQGFLVFFGVCESWKKEGLQR